MILARDQPSLLARVGRSGSQNRGSASAGIRTGHSGTGSRLIAPKVRPPRFATSVCAAHLPARPGSDVLSISPALSHALVALLSRAYQFAVESLEDVASQ